MARIRLAVSKPSMPGHVDVERRHERAGARAPVRGRLRRWPRRARRIPPARARRTAATGCLPRPRSRPRRALLPPMHLPAPASRTPAPGRRSGYPRRRSRTAFRNAAGAGGIARCPGDRLGPSAGPRASRIERCGARSSPARDPHLSRDGVRWRSSPRSPPHRTEDGPLRTVVPWCEQASRRGAHPTSLVRVAESSLFLPRIPPCGSVSFGLLTTLARRPQAILRSTSGPPKVPRSSVRRDARRGILDACPSSRSPAASPRAKSTIARRLAEHGAIIVDADQIVRDVQQPGSPVLAAIAAEFGDGMLRADGSLDRAALGAHGLRRRRRGRAG